MTLREAIYSKDYSEGTKYKLLFLADSKTWVEDMLDLVKELDDSLEKEDNQEERSSASVGGIQIRVD